MKLCWRRVDYPLLRPLKVGRRVLYERSVLELKLAAETGHETVAEASPLPGLHAEELEDLPAMLPLALGLLQEQAGPHRPPGAAPWERPEWLTLPPSLRLALEAALEALAGRRRRSNELPPAPPATALFDGAVRDLASELTGQRRIKIKVGRRALREEIAVVRKLRHALAEGAEIRLDANQAFSLEEAVEFAMAVRDLDPRWIEEPLRDPADIPEFLDRCGLPVALDESLRDPRFADLGGLPGVAAWIVKPALFGLYGTRTIFASAVERANRPVCVVSSCFEGTVGLALLRDLAREAPGLPAPGLGTAEWLGEPRPGRWIETHAPR